jgi:hypothetical protein
MRHYIQFEKLDPEVIPLAWPSWLSTIPEWLASLGMAEYTERFAENGIEIDVLSELTDQDLEKLGVLLGHRRRMLKAIRELAQPPPAAPRVAAAASSAPQDSAERRPLTVMFCDFVGSTPLSSRIRRICVPSSALITAAAPS